MRDSLRALVGDDVPDHPGLAYEVWAPVGSHGRDRGKVPDQLRAPWLDEVCAASRIGPEHGYREAYKTWTRSLRVGGGLVLEVRSTSRLLIGHGNPSATEVGLSLHRTWGVPFIPGSALKGLLNHYVDATFGPDASGKDPYADHPEPDRAPYQGPAWRGRRLVHAPGAIHRALFGAPDVSVEQATPSQRRPEHSFATRGAIEFLDALLVPPTAEAADLPILVPDVCTVHQSSYYRGRDDAAWPNDFDAPIPIQFLSVRPGTQLLLALTGEPRWAQFAMDLLADALGIWGVGGKTAAGYGRFMRVGETKLFEARTAAPRDPLLDELREFLKPSADSPAAALTRKEKFEALLGEWLERLLALPVPARKSAWDLIRAERNARVASLADDLKQKLGLP